MKKQYYIVIFNENEPMVDLIQSKWFKTKKEAINWLKEEIYFHDSQLVAGLYSAELDKDGKYDGVESEGTLSW